jgi:hypothetical protein
MEPGRVGRGRRDRNLFMRKIAWKQLALSLLSGSILLQTASCVEFSTGLTAIATSVTAGGVIYLVYRIVQ